MKLLSALCLFFVAISPSYGEDKHPWLMIDAAAQTLFVMQDGVVLERFGNIAIGRNGTSAQRRSGDNTTPLGIFNIAWVNRQSKYKTFFGFDYPTQTHAALALEQQRISSATYDVISKAILKGQLPPQNTPLGGHLGIHGLGRANPKIHNSLNWTQGCIALTNKQIDALAKWIRVGTRVVVSSGRLAALSPQ